ncbi:hypothetical protein [Candidatus Aciduliprofundum boonei]|uniref:Uncharacterized protein n=1 Tax=Aciduliprofundum boonei (strain DSM 19572 / T469) TaxID=439481 RepID=D3TAR5_ACIB4|nr:hypothetical protein [Candidatus Aciduliprofundum boonei]ADD09194.1 hypothetical protein Aboo_1387 [Aciduliprofundum boonei T469]HII55842.1 hypothetical protein [Candidatus Aciduliprofundum boonei]
MMEDYFYPQRLPEKLKLRFLKNTLKIGEFADFEGFIVKLQNSGIIRKALWTKIAPIIGDFEVKGITPFPENGFPIMPIIVPKWVRLKGCCGIVRGKIYDLSQFSNMKGRFLLVENFEIAKIEDYLVMEKSGLDGGRIYNLFDSAFPETSRDVMLSFFISSGIYESRIGGCTVTLLDSLSKYYTSNFKDVRILMSLLPSILTRNSTKVEVVYDEPIEIRVLHPLKIKYTHLNLNNALRFYPTRRGKEWEKSAITESTIKIENLIGSAEIPFIPYAEEMKFDVEDLKEYAVDILSFVVKKHLEAPEIDTNRMERAKEKLILKIEKEFPLLTEAMKVGIVMDIADVNGFGEHTVRLIDSWRRLGMQDAEEKIMGLYDTLFERIEDVLQDRLRRELSSLDERRRIERVINRVLWELNILKPEGWSFFYFEKKLGERGVENAEKILKELLQKGLVIEKRKNLFLAVARL